MRISDWSSDVCSSDLRFQNFQLLRPLSTPARNRRTDSMMTSATQIACQPSASRWTPRASSVAARAAIRSEEHTSELQSLMRISYAVFCLKKKKKTKRHIQEITHNSASNGIQYAKLKHP